MELSGQKEHDINFVIENKKDLKNTFFHSTFRFPPFHQLRFFQKCPNFTLLKGGQRSKKGKYFIGNHEQIEFEQKIVTDCHQLLQNALSSLGYLKISIFL